MDLYQLAYFVEIARQKNFTRAAERLHMAQPALSQQMRRLEEELGAPLFVRGRKQTLLTPAGEALFTQAQSLLALAERAKQTVAEVAQLRRGRLVIATVPTLSASWLPRLIQDFQKTHPFIELILREESSAGVAELVETGAAEIGFLQLPADEELFAVEELITEAFHVLLPARHKLAARPRLELAELRREPFIFYKGKVRSVLLEACRIQGFEPRVVCESTALETVRALVQAGLGVAILPELALTSVPARTKVLPLHNPVLKRTLGRIRRKNQPWSQAAAAFVALGSP